MTKNINPFCLESYLKADIYSLSLILWEINQWLLSQYLMNQTLNKYDSIRTELKNVQLHLSADSVCFSNSNSNKTFSNSSLNGPNQLKQSKYVYVPAYQDYIADKNLKEYNSLDCLYSSLPINSNKYSNGTLLRNKSIQIEDNHNYNHEVNYYYYFNYITYFV